MEQEEKYIKISPHALSRGIEIKNALYLLLLKEVDGERCLPVIVSKEEERTLYKAMRNADFSSLFLFRRLVESCNVEIKFARLWLNRNGLYRCELQFLHNGETNAFPVAPSDGVLISMCYDIPLLISSDDFKKQFYPNSNPINVNIPLAGMNIEFLEEAIEVAVKKEEFEVAEILNKELKRRKASGREETKTL